MAHSIRFGPPSQGDDSPDPVAFENGDIFVPAGARGLVFAGDWVKLPVGKDGADVLFVRRRAEIEGVKGSMLQRIPEGQRQPKSTACRIGDFLVGEDRHSPPLDGFHVPAGVDIPCPVESPEGYRFGHAVVEGQHRWIRYA